MLSGLLDCIKEVNSTTKIFVYGTLVPTAEDMKAKGTEVCRDSVKGFDVRDLGPFPAAVRGEGTMQGVVVEVTNATILYLDRYEGDNYRKVQAYTEGSGERVTLYLFNKAHAIARYPLVEDGKWWKD